MIDQIELVVGKLGWAKSRSYWDELDLSQVELGLV